VKGAIVPLSRNTVFGKRSVFAADEASTKGLDVLAGEERIEAEEDGVGM
jgi:hypothetical protein